MLLVRPPRQRLVVLIMNTLESTLQSNDRLRLTLRREDLPSGGKIDATTLIRLIVLLITVVVSPFCRAQVEVKLPPVPSCSIDGGTSRR